MKVAQSCPILCDPMDYSLWNSSGQNTGWNGHPFPSPGDLPNPEMEPRSPALQADSLPAEPQGKLFYGQERQNYSLVFLNTVTVPRFRSNIYGSTILKSFLKCSKLS